MGMMGKPVALANCTTPTLATCRGPFGPSGVNTRLPPDRPRRTSRRKASAPPLVLDPRTASNPNRATIRQINSPSRCWLMRIWALRPGMANGIISCCACQKARIVRCPWANIRDTCSPPSVFQRIVRCSSRITEYPTGGTTATLSAFVTRFDQACFVWGTAGGLCGTESLTSSPLLCGYCGRASANCIAWRRL